MRQKKSTSFSFFFSLFFQPHFCCVKILKTENARRIFFFSHVSSTSFWGERPAAPGPNPLPCHRLFFRGSSTKRPLAGGGRDTPSIRGSAPAGLQPRPRPRKRPLFFSFTARPRFKRPRPASRRIFFSFPWGMGILGAWAICPGRGGFPVAGAGRDAPFRTATQKPTRSKRSPGNGPPQRHTFLRSQSSQGASERTARSGDGQEAAREPQTNFSLVAQAQENFIKILKRPKNFPGHTRGDAQG